MKIPRATDEFVLTIPPEVTTLETYDGLYETLVRTPVWRFSGGLLQTFLPASLDIGVERVGETDVYLLTPIDYTVEPFDHAVILDAADGLFDLRYVRADLLIASRHLEPVDDGISVSVVSQPDFQIYFDNLPDPEPLTFGTLQEFDAEVRSAPPYRPAIVNCFSYARREDARAA